MRSYVHPQQDLIKFPQGVWVNVALLDLLFTGRKLQNIVGDGMKAKWLDNMGKIKTLSNTHL